MNYFTINVLIDNVEYVANVKIENNILTITYNNEKLTISLKDVKAIKKDNEEILHIALNKKIITFKGNVNIFDNYFSSFKTYNESNIKVNSKQTLSLKTPLGICTLYTLLYLIIYRAMIGFSLYQHWDVSDISAIISGILTGGGEDYPTDTLQKIFFILLIIEVITFILLNSKSRKDSILLLQNPHNEINQQIYKHAENNNLDTLEKLKGLLDKNLITQEDYDKKKQEILNKL